MNDNAKAKLYDDYLNEYHRLENQINAIKMNKFDLNESENSQIALLERKKSYIMGRVTELGV